MRKRKRKFSLAYPDAAVSPLLLEEIVASRSKIKGLTVEALEAFAKQLGQRHHTPNVDAAFLLHVLKKNPPS